MSRSLTAAMGSKLTQQEGVEPILVVEMTWPSQGVAYYGDRDVTIGMHVISGKLAELSDIVSQVGSDMRGTTSSVSVVLNDADQTLYARILTTQVELVPARVMFYEGSLSSADAVELYAGRVGSPITWDEANRQLKFDIVSGVSSREIAFTPEASDIGAGEGTLDEDADGKPWPIALGVARDIPCPLVIRGPRTVLSNDIDSGDMSFSVEDATGFSASASLIVDGERMTGSFSGDTYTVTARNVKWYDAVTDARSGADVDNPFVLWVQGGASKILIGKFFIIANVPGGGVADKTRYNFCVGQKGDKCLFEKPWTKNGDDFWAVGSGIDVVVKRYAWEWLDQSNQIGTNAAAWATKAGAEVMEFGNWTDKYIVSSHAIYSGGGVLRVAAFRQHQKNVAGLEKRTLVAIPEDYYEVTYANATIAPGAPEDPTTIKFNPTLDLYGQGWETDQIYVCAYGNIGANTADQIQWVIENGTDLSIDTDSFDAVHDKIAKYRSDCAILGGGDALSVAQDMAFQARCAVVENGSTAKLIYLSEQPTTQVMTLNNDVVVEDSVVNEHADTDQMWTKVVGKWQKWYSHADQGKPDKLVPREVGTDDFGEKKEEISFWIYQHKAWVKKSVDFWAQRKGYIWRMLRCQALLPALRLEPWDRVKIDLTDIFATPVVIGWVQEWRYKTDSDVIELLVWTPIKSGSLTASSDAYLDDSGDTANPNPSSKIKRGTTEIAKVTPVSFTLASESLQRGSRVFAVVTAQKSTTALGPMGGANMWEHTYTIDVYPRGMAYPASGSAFLRAVSTSGTPAAIGALGSAAMSPGGFYIWIE